MMMNNAMIPLNNNIAVCNIGGGDFWPYQNGLPWWQQYTYPIGQTFTYASVPPVGIEIAAVCAECQKREVVASMLVPANWIHVTAGGIIKVFCSHKCVEKHAHEAAKASK